MKTVTQALYAQFVQDRCKPGHAIQIPPGHVHLLHMALGIAGESGELVDAVKKSIIYSRPLDVENVYEELGDLLFYIQGVCNHMGTDLDTLIERNMEKLGVRYPNGYSDDAANARADKQ